MADDSSEVSPEAAAAANKSRLLAAIAAANPTALTAILDEQPAGSQLLKPHKGFVVKTWSRAAGRKDFDRELGKVFINVCIHEEIEPPEATEVSGHGPHTGPTRSALCPRRAPSLGALLTLRASCASWRR